MKGIDMFMKLLCFNIGLTIAASVGLFAISGNVTASDIEGYLPFSIANITLEAFITCAGAIAGGIVGYFSGAVLQGSAIGAFLTFMSSTWVEIKLTFDAVLLQIEPSGSGVAHTVVGIVIVIIILINVFFILQFAGGGWKAIE